MHRVCIHRWPLACSRPGEDQLLNQPRCCKSYRLHAAPTHRETEQIDLLDPERLYKRNYIVRPALVCRRYLAAALPDASVVENNNWPSSSEWVNERWVLEVH